MNLTFADLLQQQDSNAMARSLQTLSKAPSSAKKNGPMQSVSKRTLRAGKRSASSSMLEQQPAVARPLPVKAKRQLQQPMVLETRDDDGDDGANNATDTGTRHLSTSHSLVMTTEDGTTTVQNEALTLLALLPNDLADELKDVTHNLTDIVLDLGCQPFAWVAGKRRLLGGQYRNRVVTSTDIGSIVHALGGTSTATAFGKDNRAGLEQQLHRISAVRNRQGDVIGLTLRVGRHITGCATMIVDLLFESSPTDESILFLGAPGSGKTTMIREVARLLAEQYNVCIVDTSNEIAGAGNTPHSCVGFARRMMVPSLDQQSAVMVECVQNHTPSVMVIDEIGRSTEVQAARTCKLRGVRLIASAHGDLRSLVKNQALRGLIGGVQTVTMGDYQAKLEAKRHNAPFISKTKAERSGAPTFGIIVELSRGEHDSLRVVRASARAVDRILNGQPYCAERRSRDPKTGKIQIAFEKA